LAIALAKLGARKVWAVDNDPVALKVARENLRCNGVEEKVQLSGTALRRIRKSFPVVVANLTAEAIMDLADVLQKKVATAGLRILSGILNPKATEVMSSFFPDAFVVIKRRHEE